MSNSVWPHRQQPTRLCCPWDSPGKNTGVGCHQKMISIFVNIIQVDNRYICEYLVQCYIKCQFKGKYVVSHNERSVKKKKSVPLVTTLHRICVFPSITFIFLYLPYHQAVLKSQWPYLIPPAYHCFPCLLPWIIYRLFAPLDIELLFWHRQCKVISCYLHASSY